MIKQVVLDAILLAATISIVGLEQQSALAGTKSQNHAGPGCIG